MFDIDVTKNFTPTNHTYGSGTMGSQHIYVDVYLYTYLNQSTIFKGENVPQELKGKQVIYIAKMILPNSCAVELGLRIIGRKIASRVLLP